jgi:ribonucleoside-diphosphate reductase alpha chain
MVVPVALPAPHSIRKLWLACLKDPQNTRLRMQDLKIIKRTGEVVEFDAQRIRNAILAALRATGEHLPATTVDRLLESICQEIAGRFNEFYPNVENVQDIVEKHLMLEGLYGVAKAYILYRAERQDERESVRKQAVENAKLGRLTVQKRDGRQVLFNVKIIEEAIRRAAEGYEADIDVDLIVRGAIDNVFDGIPTDKIEQAMVLATTAYIERDVAYSYVASRLLLQKHFKEVVGRSIHPAERDSVYRETFVQRMREGIESGLYDPRMAAFDLDRLATELDPERDYDFQYLGMQTLCERYFIRRDGRPLELPQAFWMRVAMGLAVNEGAARDDRAIEFYRLYAERRFISSTPTLFHAGTAHPQLSSCYLTTVDDHLEDIFKSYADNAQLSKWSGGIGNDWSNVRATGARIESTNVESQGVVPFLKIANDVTMAINRSGRRRGATCAYLETWHYDVEDFLDLRKNTGDDRRRTHDMNTANWIPDLFMKRVMQDGEWTLFSPDETPDLHDLYGSAFDRAYEAYEARARNGEIYLFKTLRAKELWRKMLTMLFETGHPWITFKDACNLRSPQDHVGVVHSSNLCTEITLNTSRDETAVCNLGSVNLAQHVAADGSLDESRLAQTVQTAIRMLDNVIDINFYPTPEAERSNLQHRPIGLGIMGFQDLLFKMDVAFAAREALETADYVMELVSYHAIKASSQLAAERGAYPSFAGSKWDRGIFPLDTLDLLERERGWPVDVSREARLDWAPLRAQLRQQGMRNSNTMAIAPTATISNIAGCFPSIEPIYKNLYVKANISGEFTVVNHYLVDDLKALGLWNDEMLDRLKYCDGNVSSIPEIPERIKAKYKEAFEIDPIWCLRLTAARGKWIDQSQSHNVFMKGTSGKLLSEIYGSAWRMGLKTTYYLRTLAVSQIEKSTLDAGKYGFTQRREYGSLADVETAAEAADRDEAAFEEALASLQVPRTMTEDGIQLCRIDDPDCEACQ